MQSLSKTTADELLKADYVAQIFDSDDPIWQQQMWVKMRVRAKELKVVKEFNAIYDALKAEFAPGPSAAHADYNGLDLRRGNKGEVLPTTENFAIIFRDDPKYADLRFNLMTQSIERGQAKQQWTDTDSAEVRLDIESRYGIYNKDKLRDALNTVARERAYHPVRDIIQSLEWDGIPRIYTLLVKWLKCEDTPYTREVSRLIFAGGIHRIFSPGCKFDDVAVIGGRQGCGKSSFVRWLALDPMFYSSISEFDGQRGVESLEGKWIVEMEELLAMARAKEVESIKAFLTRQSDHYRRPWAEFATDLPRQCIFVGTTNRQTFIADKTGGRRFYPIWVNSDGYELHDHIDEIKADISQCWAEAYSLYEQGLLSPYGDRALRDSFQSAQSEATEEDYRVGMIASFLANRTETCLKQVWDCALHFEDRPMTRRDSNELSAIMESMPNWHRTGEIRRFQTYGPQRAWVKNGC